MRLLILLIAAASLAFAEKPLVKVERPPFKRGQWTHVVFTFLNFNTGKPDGVVTLYVNGESRGSISPRQQILSAPYALNAANAASAQNVLAGGVNTVALADGAVSTAKLSPGVGWNPFNSVSRTVPARVASPLTRSWSYWGLPGFELSRPAISRSSTPVLAWV